jgi:hypothetical protein
MKGEIIMNVADTLIHIDENLDDVAQERIVQRMREIPGVLAPRFNKNKEHMLLIAFDPEGTQSINLLENVKKLGYHAELVGL